MIHQMIHYGGELIRISPKDSKKLEYSKNGCKNNQEMTMLLHSWYNKQIHNNA